MSGWDDPQYEMEGESGGGGTVIGFPSEAYFQDSEYGPELVMVLHRSHPELTPNAKAEVRWSWRVAGAKERENWTVAESGARMIHNADKPFNAGTAMGKLFAAVKNVFPYVEGFDPKQASSWLGLEKLGDAEWGWIEEPKRVLDETTGKWGTTDDPTKVNRYLVPVAYIGDGASNGHVEEVDLASLGISADDLPAIQAAAKSAAPGKDGMSQALVTYAMKNSALMGALTSNPEGLRFALCGEI